MALFFCFVFQAHAVNRQKRKAKVDSGGSSVASLQLKDKPEELMNEIPKNLET